MIVAIVPFFFLPISTNNLTCHSAIRSCRGVVKKKMFFFVTQNKRKKNTYYQSPQNKAQVVLARGMKRN